MNNISIVSITALVAAAHGAFSQHRLEGVVRNNQGQPVPFALVSLNKTQRAVTAGQDGLFVFPSLRPGEYIVSAGSVGFKSDTDTVQVDGDTRLEFVLTASGAQLDEVVVNATRVDGNSGMAFNNIDGETLRKQNLGLDAPYALSQVPGVVVNSDAGNGIGYTGLRIRGSDATRVNVTINGVPVNDAESQGTFWVNMPDLLSSVNSIQVQRGVGGSSNGAGAFGATINLETNRLQEKPYAQLISTAGSYNTLRNTLAAGTGLLNNRFALDARASRIVSDGYVDRASSRLNSYYLSGGYYGKKTVVKLINFYGQEKTYQAWNLVSEENLKTGKRTYNELGLYTDEFGNERAYPNQVDNYTQNNFQLHVVRQLNSRFSINLTGHYTRGYGYYEEYRSDDEPAFYGLQMPLLLTADSQQITSSDLVRQRWLDNHFGGAVFNLNFRASPALELKLGGGYNSYFGKHFGRVIWARYAGMSEPGHQYYFNTANKNDGNIYAKTSWLPLRGLSLFADLQLRRVHYAYLGPDNADTLAQHLRAFTFFNPKVGLSYDLGTSLNIYASASVGNKEPNRNDFIENRPENQPRHEELLDIEEGVKYRSRKFALTLNLYEMRYRNQLVLNGEINDVGASKRINVPLSYRRGIELELSYDLNRYFSFSLNSAYSMNKIVAFDEFVDHYTTDFSYVGNFRLQSYELTDISFSPGIVSSIQLLLKPVKGLEIALVGKYVGRQFLDNTSTLSRSIDPFKVADLRFNYTFPGNPELSLMLGIYNVLNEVYETNGYTFNWYVEDTRYVYNYLAPAAPLNVLGGFSLKF